MIAILSTLLVALIAVLFIIHFWWKNAIKRGIVSAGTISKRLRFRNIQILLIILAVSLIFYLWELLSGEEIGGIELTFMLGMMFGLSRTLFEPVYTTDVISGLENFTLYLRPFDVDIQSAIKKRSGYINTHFLMLESLEKVICKTISKKIAPVYAIGNPSSVLPTTLSSSSIYASDENWKSAVAELAQKAKMIILRVGDTDGCKWELLHCFDFNYLKKTIFIADDIDDIDLLQNHISSKIPDPIRSIDFRHNSIGLWLNDSGSWEFKVLKKNHDCSDMITSFINIHSGLKKRKINFKTVLHTKSKSIWSDTLSLILNPIAYILYNRWSVKMIFAILSYILLSFCAAIFPALTIATDEDENLGVLILFGIPIFLIAMIPWIIFAPKYTTAINSWGGQAIKAKGNKTLAIWLLILNLFMILIGIFVYSN